MNTWKRRLLALLSVPLLAVPSAAGVYLWLSPHIGPVAAGMTAAGFESLYIGINILVISSPELRRYARNVALSAVLTAVVFNTLARYQAMVCPIPKDPDAAAMFVCTLRSVTFDRLALALAVLESIPLAGLAYAISVLLHRLSEERAARSPYRARLARRLWQLRKEARQAQRARAEVAALEAMLAQAREQLAQLATNVAQPDPELAQLRALTAQQEQAIAQLKAELAQPIVVDGIDILHVARYLRNKGIPSRETAELLGQKESTLRSRLKATNGNGVHHE